MSFELLQQHERYYLESGMTVFLVENTLFKIPRYLLVNESPVFENMFRIPSCNQSEGVVDSAPIRLHQVDLADFERLLELLYPLSVEKFSTGTEQWGQSEWTSILHLASRWQMLAVRSRAISQLSSCASPTSKVLLGRAYDHPPWIRDGYHQLCFRDEPMTTEDTEGLTMKEVVGVANARERIRSRVMRSSCLTKRAKDTFGRRVEEYETHYDFPDNEHQDFMLHCILDEIFGIPEPFVPRSRLQPSPTAPHLVLELSLPMWQLPADGRTGRAELYITKIESLVLQ